MRNDWKCGLSPELKTKISPSSRLQQIKIAFDMQRQFMSYMERIGGAAMDDISFIPELYEAYTDFAVRNGFGSDRRNGNRKQFLFIVLFLYCPNAIFGGEIRKDIRNAVASALHLKSGHIVYSMRDRAAVWYRNYPGFREEVDTAYQEMINILEK